MDTKKFDALIKVRERRSEQAKKALAEARGAVEKARRARAEIDRRIRRLRRALEDIARSSYSGDSLALDQLLNAQSHLKHLREELANQNESRERAESELARAEKIRGEKAVSYLKMQRKQDNVTEQRHRYRKIGARRGAAHEEELAGELWLSNKLSGE